MNVVVNIVFTVLCMSWFELSLLTLEIFEIAGALPAWYHDRGPLGLLVNSVAETTSSLINEVQQIFDFDYRLFTILI